jgi:hypothetical protein
VGVTPQYFSVFHNTVPDGEAEKRSASAIAFLRPPPMIPLAIKSLLKTRLTRLSAFAPQGLLAAKRLLWQDFSRSL